MSENITRYDEEVPVLIVGGSVVGLSMALFLAWHDVPVLLVERHATTSIHPRAGVFNTRTMELFRQVGLEAAIFEREAPLEPSGEMGLRLESLLGKVLDTTEAVAHQQAAWSNPFTSPTRTAMLSQDKLEPLLQARATALGSDMRFGTELVHFEQKQDAIYAQIRNRTTGQERSIRAQYLIAADGNKSSIRQQLGIKSYGYGRLGKWVSILFRADLSKELQGRHVTLCFVNNITLDGILGQSGDHWALFATVKSNSEETSEAPSEAFYRKLVYAALGAIPDRPVEIISALPWELASRVAERYQQGRVFLAGDAAHVMTTMGAFGANTGIADAHNLAWKLAFVLKKQAAPDLLVTYGAERQTAANLAVGVSTGLYAYRLPHLEQREAIAKSAEELLSLIRQDPSSPSPTAFSVMNGYHYRSAAILSEESSTALLFENEPSGSPGTRAPHVQVMHNGEQFSLLDLYGKNFVLLTGAAGQRWHTLFTGGEKKLGITVDTYAIGPGQQYIDSDANFLASYSISEAGAALVRPDGFIAWREQRAPAQTTEEGQQLLARLLGWQRRE